MTLLALLLAGARAADPDEAEPAAGSTAPRAAETPVAAPPTEAAPPAGSKPPSGGSAPPTEARTTTPAVAPTAARARAAPAPVAWSLAEPLDPTGLVALPAGEALLVRVSPAGAPLAVVPGAPDPGAEPDEGGPGAAAPLAAYGVAGGLLVPAERMRRVVRVVAPPDATVTLHRSGAPDAIARWAAWEQAALRAVRRGEPAPTPPWGGARLAASITLRARAVGDARVAALGVLHDAALVRPLDPVTHAIAPERAVGPGAPVAVEGPGAVTLRVHIPPGELRRTWVRVAIDGRVARAHPLASTGAAPTVLRVWIPPGAHQLAVEVPGVPGAEVGVTAAPLRPKLLGPTLLGPTLPRSATGIAAAELAWLRGDLAAARAAFAPFADAPGPAGELARARLLASTTDAAEATHLARFDGLTPEGVEVLAGAAVTAAALLPDAVVLEAARLAHDPDLAALARWLDARSGARPAGVALLDLAGPEIPTDPSLLVDAARARALATRWTHLLPLEGGGSPALRWSPTGPGIPRVDARAGTTVTLDLPRPPGDRAPLLRLDALAPTVVELDGEPLSLRPGPIQIPSTPGPHTLTVRGGHVRVVDADYAVGGERVYEWEALPAPATWAIPQPGVPVDLAITAEGAGEWIAAFDDGRTVPFTLVAGRQELRLQAPAHASTVTLHGPAGGFAAVAMRTPVERPTLATETTAPSEAADLAALARLTRAVDAGEPGARAARARVLARLGQLAAARRDLAVVLAADPEAGRALARDIAPDIPSAPKDTPRPAVLALATAGWEGEPPSDPAALEALGRKLGQPEVIAVAGAGWLAEGDVARAILAARAAGAWGAPLLRAVDARLDWAPVQYADASAGMVQVRRDPEPEHDDALWRRVRAARLAAPWPLAETIVLRGRAGHEASFTGGRWELQVFCRVESGSAQGCRVPVRVGEAPATPLEIPDGAVRTVDGEGFGAHTVHVGAPSSGQALVLRLVVDGAVQRPVTTLSALRATPDTPVRVTVAAPTALRVEVVRGVADVGGERVAAGSRTVLPLPGAGPSTVTLGGDADVLLAVALLGPAPEPATIPTAPVVPPPPPRIAAADLTALYDAHTAAPARLGRVPGDGGTWEVAANVTHARLIAPVEPWTAVEASGAWMRASAERWLIARGWARGPKLAGGLVAEAGTRWETGRLGLRVQGGAGTGVVGAAGGVGAEARVVEERRLDPVHALRLDARLNATAWTEAAPTPVDPRAWSAWGADHPVWLSAGVGWLGAPTRDLRLETSLRATTNTGPSIDNVALLLGADLLVGNALVLSPSALLKWRFADEDRRTAGAWVDLRLRGDWVRWTARTDRLGVWGEIGVVQGSPVGGIGVRVLLPDGRGLADVPPGAELFRATRGPS